MAREWRHLRLEVAYALAEPRRARLQAALGPPEARVLAPQPVALLEQSLPLRARLNNTNGLCGSRRWKLY